MAPLTIDQLSRLVPEELRDYYLALPPGPFNYTNAVREVVSDIVATLPDFDHVRLDEVLFSFDQARKHTEYGRYASCTGMRFQGGAETELRRGRLVGLQKTFHEGREILYAISVMLPRFHVEQDYRFRIDTLVHEVFHISPEFNGDYRRFAGGRAHGHSRVFYDSLVEKLTDRYFELSPKANSWDFLKLPLWSIHRRPGGVVGTKLPKPKIIPL